MNKSVPSVFIISTLLSQPVMADKAVQGVSIEPLSMGSTLQIIASLIFVLLVFGAVVFVMRRVSGMNPTARGHMKIVDGLSLGTRDRIVLLQVGDEQVLLGISPGQIRTLHVMQETVEFSGNQVPELFSEKLKQVMAGGKQRVQPDADVAESSVKS